MSERKVPKLRFAGFTDDWKQRKLGDCSEIITGGTPTTSISEYWFPKEIPWMSSGEVNKLRIKNTDTKISMKGLQNSNAKWLPENSILIALAGQGKTRGMVAINSIPLTTNQSIAGIVTNQDLHYEFLFQYLISQYEALRTMSSGGDIRGGLNKTIIANIEFYCPTLPEQQAIGEFFKQLDDTIAFHQREWEKYKNLKISYLEKMFPQENENKPQLRFPNFTDAWKQRKLGEIGETRSGIGFPEKEQGGKEGIPFYKVSDMNIVGNEIFMQNANHFVTLEQIERNNWKTINSLPAIIFAKVGAALLLNRKRLVLNNFLIDNNTMAYILNNKEWDFYFAKTLFDTLNFANLSQVGALPFFNGSDVENIEVFVPTLPEQQAIGEFFKQLDDTIAFHQRELEKYKNLKNGYLKQMFV